MTDTTRNRLIEILRKKATDSCIEKAEQLERGSTQMLSLNLRDLGLNAADMISIAQCLKEENELNQKGLKSISFSYNPLLGDSGAIALSRYLSNDICEIGLVNCGIGDAGGIEILNWMTNSPKLKMICMEGNNFSEKLKQEFRKFGRNNPHMLLVY